MLGRTAMMSMNQIWKSKDVSLTTKCRLDCTIVFPIMTCGCESWTVKKMDIRKIDSFNLCCWRRLLHIPWTAKIANKEVLKHIKLSMSLEGNITKLRLNYFGHAIRSTSLEKDTMLRMVSDKDAKDDKDAKEHIGWM